MSVQKAAPLPVPYDLILERCGYYVVVFDVDTDAVPVSPWPGHGSVKPLHQM
ncbi:hypothetical protein ACWF9B_22050 [Streptomyces sp. NPDC055089]